MTTTPSAWSTAPTVVPAPSGSSAPLVELRLVHPRVAPRAPSSCASCTLELRLVHPRVAPRAPSSCAACTVELRLVHARRRTGGATRRYRTRDSAHHGARLN